MNFYKHPEYRPMSGFFCFSLPWLLVFGILQSTISSVFVSRGLV